MLKPVAFANAAAVVTAGVYLICAMLAYAAPNLLFTLAKPWFHLINLEVLRADKMAGPASVLIGLILIAAITWVTTYLTIDLYNRFAKSK